MIISTRLMRTSPLRFRVHLSNIEQKLQGKAFVRSAWSARGHDVSRTSSSHTDVFVVPLVFSRLNSGSFDRSPRPLCCVSPSVFRPVCFIFLSLLSTLSLVSLDVDSSCRLFSCPSRFVFADAYIEIRYMLEANLMTRFVRTKEFRREQLVFDEPWGQTSPVAV